MYACGPNGHGSLIRAGTRSGINLKASTKVPPTVFTYLALQPRRLLDSGQRWQIALGVHNPTCGAGDRDHRGATPVVPSWEWRKPGFTLVYVEQHALVYPKLRLSIRA